MINKKAQIENPMIVLIAIIIGLIVIGPFVLKIVNSVLTPFGNAVGNQTAQAGENVGAIKTTFGNFWDWVIIMALLVNIILLFISAFLIDTHPVFLVLYIVFGFFIFVLVPEIFSMIDAIYDSASFAGEVSQLAMLDFLRNYLSIFILGIFFVTGIIIYAKFRWGGQPR